MKRLLVILLLLLSSVTAWSQIQLSPDAEIHILTCGPYQPELYSAFGHSAVRVKDPVNNIDYLYNYGVFDFDQPNFYLNFARGFLNYKLALMDYRRFRDFYIYQNRYIHEQVLNLTREQKQRYFDFLQWNNLPENQYYYYDYFYDNCATRIRDGLATVFGDSLVFDGSYIDTKYTIRDLTDLYLVEQPWGDLGIDLCLGLPMDTVATPDMYMFLPDYIEQGFNHATLQRNGLRVPLVKETIITYESSPEPDSSSTITPLILFSVLFLIGIVLTIYEIRNKRRFRWFDTVLFTVVGLIGWLLFLLWVATDHQAAARNLNLLWALPPFFPVGLWALKRTRPTWFRWFFKVVFFAFILLILFWGTLPQNLHNSLVPLVALLALRAWRLSR
jgi:hypothetical protein